MLRGIALGFIGVCLAFAMILVAVMPQTLSNLYYGIVGNGVQFTAAAPTAAFRLAKPMPIVIDIVNTATSDRIYRLCPAPYPERPYVSRQGMTEVPLTDAWKTFYDKGPAKGSCKDITIHAGEHQPVSIDLHDMFDLRDPGNYYFSMGMAEGTDERRQRHQVALTVTP